MEMWQEESARWWARSSEAERLAAAATVGRWARGVADGWEFLDPQESREMYRVLGEGLIDWSRQQPVEVKVIDLGAREAWVDLPERAKGPWVGFLGQELGPEGKEAARVVSLALAPPLFRSLPAPEQVDLLRTIAGEIETNLERDPAWYSRATPAFAGLARSIRGLEGLMTRPPEAEQCRLWWSHLSGGAREQVLEGIAQFARWAARGEEVRPPVRRELLDLARSAEQIVAPARSLPLARE